MMAIIRQGHKWIALILGIQLALWMLSGLGMARVDLHAETQWGRNQTPHLYQVFCASVQVAVWLYSLAAATAAQAPLLRENGSRGHQT